MSVLLDCKLPERNLDTFLTRLEVELMSLDIADPPKRAELEQTLRHAGVEGARLKHEILVEGKAPKPPVNGKIEWAQDFFKTGFAVDKETGIIDYRKRMENLAVKEGQLLAKTNHPREGQPGSDVHGKPVSPEKARAARMTVGENVRVEKGDNFDSYYAECEGRVRWALNMLAVDDVYEIAGDVGLETGHIKHSGVVLVRGDVRPGSRVEAGGDIEVMGTVESAEIVAGGNLTVHGGVTGSGERKIKVGGSVYAKFILEADIEAGEDVVVEKEIIQSNIKARGALLMESGRVVGGTAVILGGISVGQAGSDGNVPTELVSAEDYSFDEEINGRQEEVGVLNKNLEKIHKAVDPLMARIKLLSPQQREAATELLANSTDMEMRLDELATEKVDIEEDSQLRSKPRILIARKIYPETILRIKQCGLIVRDEADGPLRAGMVEGRVALLAD
jgi:uncharacterized protein (DUF342 family)